MGRGVEKGRLQSYIESRDTYVCGAARERERCGSPFWPRQPRTRNGSSEGKLIGQEGHGQ
jgi:hypothetical protein